jgi:MFS superfamily sulfate permease-like transporter
LSAVISTVSLGLLTEAPPDFVYYWSMRAWTELAMIFLVIIATVFWVCHSCILIQSIDVGIYVGIGLSLTLLVKAAGNYSMKPLKRDSENGSFIPIDDLQYQVSFFIAILTQFYPFVLMVKIATDNLTFVNTGS